MGGICALFLWHMVPGATIKRSGFVDTHYFVVCLTPSFQSSTLPLIFLFGCLIAFLIFFLYSHFDLKIFLMLRFRLTTLTKSGIFDNQNSSDERF